MLGYTYPITHSATKSALEFCDITSSTAFLRDYSPFCDIENLSRKVRTLFIEENWNTEVAFLICALNDMHFQWWLMSYLCSILEDVQWRIVMVLFFSLIKQPRFLLCLIWYCCACTTFITENSSTMPSAGFVACLPASLSIYLLLSHLKVATYFIS